jgi:hypothetical protein
MVNTGRAKVYKTKAQAVEAAVPMGTFIML